MLDLFVGSSQDLVARWPHLKANSKCMHAHAHTTTHNHTHKYTGAWSIHKSHGNYAILYISTENTHTHLLRAFLKAAKGNVHVGSGSGVWCAPDMLLLKSALYTTTAA